jgi:hypothetical protein
MHPDPRRAARRHDAESECCGHCLGEVPARAAACPRCGLAFRGGLYLYSTAEHRTPIALGLCRARPAIAA